MQISRSVHESVHTMHTQMRENEGGESGFEKWQDTYTDILFLAWPGSAHVHSREDITNEERERKGADIKANKQPNAHKKDTKRDEGSCDPPTHQESATPASPEEQEITTEKNRVGGRILWISLSSLCASKNKREWQRLAEGRRPREKNGGHLYQDQGKPSL